MRQASSAGLSLHQLGTSLPRPLSIVLEQHTLQTAVDVKNVRPGNSIEIWYTGLDAAR